MEEQNLAEICKTVSSRLLKSIRLLEILETYIDGEARLGTLTSILINDIKTSFHDIENCRQKIGIFD